MANTTVYLALRGLFPYKRWGSPFLWVGTLGVGLGVMLLIIVLSVMSGFGSTYRQKIVALGGDLRIESRDIIRNPEELISRIEKHSAVQAAAPFGQGFVMIEHNRRPAFPVVRGIDPDREAQVVPYQKEEMIKAGNLHDLDDEGVMLSSLLAKQIGAQVGASVEVYTPLMISRLGKNELLLPKTLRVVGLYETGWHDFDQNTMLTSLSTFQELYGLGDNVHGITLRLKPGSDLKKAQTEIQEIVGPLYTVSSWKELFKDFLWVLDLEKNMMFFLMLFVIVVAAFAMGAAQLMTVLRKTREIGLIMAMGATTRAVAAVYALQGALIGVTGVIVGNVLALVILAFRNPILHTIAGWTGTTETLTKYYQFYDLPMTYGLPDALAIGIAAVALATLSGLVPAMMVTRLKPAEALRND